MFTFASNQCSQVPKHFVEEHSLFKQNHESFGLQTFCTVLRYVTAWVWENWPWSLNLLLMDITSVLVFELAFHTDKTDDRFLALYDT